MTAKVVEDLVVPGGFGRGFAVRAGQFVTFVDVEGQQAGDFVALNRADQGEFVSTVHTRRRLRSIYFRIGDVLVSNHDRPMLEVIADTVGIHDITLPACDPTRYSVDFGIEDHRNCLENMHEALHECGAAIDVLDLPEPFNLFQNSPVGPLGRTGVTDPVSRPGDQVAFRALMDLTCALSPCPQDIIPGNGLNPTPLRVVIAERAPFDLGAGIRG